MRLHVCFLLLSVLGGFGIAVAYLGRTVLKTRITTIIIPTARSSSELPGALGPWRERSLSNAAVELPRVTGLRVKSENDSLRKRQTEPTGAPSPELTGALSGGTVEDLNEGRKAIAECFVNNTEHGGDCFYAFKDLQASFRGLIRTLKDPNDMEISKIFQEDWCTPTQVYQPRNWYEYSLCGACLQKGVEVTKDNWERMLDLIFNFCKSKAPSLYLLLLGVNTFYRSEAKDHYYELDQRIKDVPSLSSKFKNSPELNSATIQRSKTRTGTGPSGATGSFSAPIATQPFPTLNRTRKISPVPTSIPGQLPAGWPYTSYAVARRPGSTTTTTLFNATGSSGAIVILAPFLCRQFDLVVRVNVHEASADFDFDFGFNFDRFELED
ncbi:hypothetical protein K458DRAFT_395175 [Lentithecium fluviatile CBS 122367]|uniref:Uncharacterized protein n=1 Tax=Lentithecium fluviatile CBS 122367 TaxID=1168545 RepID=A0A6G1IIN4_9PLEO|nr:hypothetical protein K458DRAFT_395175 [Lentithecium fluviatile CBS 122367]